MNEKSKIWIEKEVFLKSIEDNSDGSKKFDKYKFAELIIRECIKEVSQYRSTTFCDGFMPENPTREDYEEFGYIRG